MTAPRLIAATVIAFALVLVLSAPVVAGPVQNGSLEEYCPTAGSPGCFNATPVSGCTFGYESLVGGSTTIPNWTVGPLPPQTSIVWANMLTCDFQSASDQRKFVDLSGYGNNASPGGEIYQTVTLPNAPVPGVQCTLSLDLATFNDGSADATVNGSSVPLVPFGSSFNVNNTSWQRWSGTFFGSGPATLSIKNITQGAMFVFVDNIDIRCECGTTAPECNGTCPNAGDVCLPHGPAPVTSCTCGPPPPCDQADSTHCDVSFCGLTVDEKCVKSTTPGAPTDCECKSCGGSAPACNGPCPTPGQSCFRDETGACSCAAPCGDSAPACNGACANTDDRCVADATGCHCEHPCSNNGNTTSCTGYCQNPAETCHTDEHNGSCFCALDCGQSAPACDGVCPSFETCVHQASGACVCQPSCGQATAPQCGGTCPVNENCQQSQANGNQCVCCAGIIINTVEGVRWTSKTRIIWDPYIPPCPVWYNVYAVTAVRLPDADHNGVADNSGDCVMSHLTTAEVTDNGIPPPGMAKFYLVGPSNGNGPEPLGPASNGITRAPPAHVCQ